MLDSKPYTGVSELCREQVPVFVVASNCYCDHPRLSAADFVAQAQIRVELSRLAHHGRP